MDAINDGFVALLGLKFTEVTGDRVHATWQVRPELLQPYGVLHGGVHCAVVETLASFGAATWFGDRGHIVGVANHTDFFRAVREGELSATATPIHRGRSQQLWLVEIADAQERLVARGQLRLHNLPADSSAQRAVTG